MINEEDKIIQDFKNYSLNRSQDLLQNILKFFALRQLKDLLVPSELISPDVIQITINKLVDNSPFDGVETFTVKLKIPKAYVESSTIAENAQKLYRQLDNPFSFAEDTYIRPLVFRIIDTEEPLDDFYTFEGDIRIRHF